MHPDVILLDCGGTLTWPPMKRINKVLEDLKGQQMDVETGYRAFYRSTFAMEDYIRRHNKYPAEDNLKLNHWVYEKGLELEGYPGLWDMDCTLELLKREGRLGKWDHTYPWVEESLIRLKDHGYRLAVVSNSDGHVGEMLTELGYAKYMETIVDSFIEQIWKPDPRLFYIALERMGLNDYVKMAKAAADGHGVRPPIMYVGDTMRADYDGSINAGLYPMLIDPLGLYRDWADERVRDMADLADKLCS